MSKKFKRQNSHRKVQTPSSWRKPRGGHSKVRQKKNGHPAMPSVGYRTPKNVRGKHPSGLEDVLVNNTGEVENLDPETDAARIASGVGGKKRAVIIEKADELDIKVLNRGDE